MKRKIGEIGGGPEAPPNAKRQKRTVSSPNYQSRSFGRTLTFPNQSQPNNNNTNNNVTGLNAEKQRRIKHESERIGEIRGRKYSREGVEIHTSINEVNVMSKKHNLQLPVPELAVVGMQSDGKSSFVEALMGFKFNVTSTEIGTRRPLIIQMKNTPTREEPVVYFYDESYSKRDDNPTPLGNVEKEILRRTDNLCGRDSVHPRPICLWIEYRHCSNLTIFDFPGFRKAREDPLGGKIEEMVLETLKNNHNLFIICLEQSTVEWVNTQVKPIIQRVDPLRKRTMFVSTKFNNRINQFRTADEVNRFLQNGIESAYPSEMYFMSLPSGIRSHNLTPAGFKERLVDTHLADYRALVEVDFDEEKYIDMIGFHRVEEHLRRLILGRYRDHLNPIQQKILGVLINAQRESQHIQARITEKEKLKVKDFLAERIHEFVAATRRGLNGSTDFIGLGAGLTLEEERIGSRCLEWPGYDKSLGLTFRNSILKLFGGAQIDRLINEFETIAHSMEYRKVSSSEVATALGLGGLFGTANAGYGQDLVRASSDLAARNSRTVFTPLVKVLITRSVHIMDHLFTKVGEFLETLNESSYEWMKEKSLSYVSDLLDELRKKVLEELETFTKVLDWEFISDIVGDNNVEEEGEDSSDEDEDDDDEEEDDDEVSLFEEEEEEEENEGGRMGFNDEMMSRSTVDTSSISRSMVDFNNNNNNVNLSLGFNSNHNNNNNNNFNIGGNNNTSSTGMRQVSPEVVPPPPPPPSSTRKTGLQNLVATSHPGGIVPPPQAKNNHQFVTPRLQRKKKTTTTSSSSSSSLNKNKKKKKKKRKKKRKKKKKKKRRGYNFLEPSKEDTVKRVMKHTRRNSLMMSPMGGGSGGGRGRMEMDTSSSDRIQMVAAKLFSGIRMMFIRFVKMKYTLDFLQPFLDGGLEKMFRTIFNDLKEEDIRGIISVTIDKDKKKKEKIDEQIRDIRNQHHKLAELKKTLAELKRRRQSANGLNMGHPGTGGGMGSFN